MSRSAVIDPSNWVPDARQLGFTFTDEESLHRLGMSLTVEGAWAVLRIDGSGGGPEPRIGPPGGPGLWKRDRDGSLRFDLPPATAEEGGPERLASLVDWAVDTSAGRLARDWKAPPEAEVREWTPRGALTVRDAPLAVLGDPGWSPEGLVPSFPELARVPESTPPARRAWAEGILVEAQSRWRLVRFGLDRESGRVRAEVNLTGAPESLLEPLYRIALAALESAARWVLLPLTVALDPSVESRLLEGTPSRPEAAERKSND